MNESNVRKTDRIQRVTKLTGSMCIAVHSLLATAFLSLLQIQVMASFGLTSSRGLDDLHRLTFTHHDRTFHSYLHRRDGADRSSNSSQLVQAESRHSLGHRLCGVMHTQNILDARQARMCRKDAGLAHTLVSAYRDMYLQCKKRFKNEKWNCADRQDRLRMLNTEFKEKSFLVALTSASLAVAVSKACDNGILESCGCSFDDRDSPGCQSSLQFGQRFARRFLRVKDSTRASLSAAVDLHNKNQGIRIIDEISVKQCRCHGLSTSCAIRTCWSRTSAADILGARLKQSYDSAVQVADFSDEHITENRIQPTNINARRTRLYAVSSQRVRPLELVYLDSSPDYCLPTDYGPGTVNRECEISTNSTSTNSSCDYLCCGRGYFNNTVVTTERCRCQAVWCCDVVCDECSHSETIYKCN